MKIADDKQVADAIKDFKQQLDNEVNKLGSVIDARVRYEQRLDQLTSLQNDIALKEHIRALIDSSALFWLAFVEVDRFKRVNDQYGHPNANQLLIKLGECLLAHTSIFPGKAQAFRAHGDEFFLVGSVEKTFSLSVVTSGLEIMRKAVGLISIPILTHKDAMSCTVSVGWASSEDLIQSLKPGDPLTDQGAIDCVELAIGEAKRCGRNRTIRYNATWSTTPTDSSRGDCGKCHCQFSFDVPTQNNHSDQPFYCPNCGERLERGSPPLSPETPTGLVGVVRVDGDAE